MILLALLLASHALAAERILIDTDCGYFGDDGAALVMLLRSPQRVQVEGITIVSGNVWARSSARYTLEILKLLGQSRIPVYLGAEMPLVHSPAMAEHAHKNWGPLEFRGAFEAPRPSSAPPGVQPMDAVQRLIRTFDANPGRITLVALGPMTNIAMALRLRPDMALKIRRLVFMGGQLRVPGNASSEAEFNFWFDPEAAQVVLRSTIPEKIMFGLDICNKALLDKEGFDRIVRTRTPVTDRFREDFGNRYPGFHKNPKATVSLWDSVVPAWLIEPALFAAPQILHLDADTRFGPSYGKVIPLDRKLAPEAAPVQMMKDLDSAKVLELFRDLLESKR